MAKMDQKQEKTWAMLCHLSGLLGCIGIPGLFPIGIPLGQILGPLVIWLIKKDESTLINEEGKEALNFQISMTIYGLACWLLSFIFIGIPLFYGLLIAWLILIVKATIKVSNGESYKYPVTIHFLK